MRLSAYIAGVGFLGPGLNDWPDAVAVLTGVRSYLPVPTVLPVPSGLPPAERRRTGRLVRLALGVALEATTRAATDPKMLPSVFASSGGDGLICNEICSALAQATREISPTRFSNSVHNAAAGYWGIATGAMTDANVLCAYDASFAAGLLDAITHSAVENRDTLLVAYDTEYPEPLHAKRPLPDALGVALVLTRERSAHALALIDVSLNDARCDTMPDAALEALRTSIPAARALPLLSELAHGRNGRVVLDYLDDCSVVVDITACA